MKKEDFLELNIDNKIEYLNTQLTKNQTVKDIRENLGIGEKALQKIIKTNGYSYNQKLKQYINTSIENGIDTKKTEYHNHDTDVSQDLTVQNTLNEIPSNLNNYKNDLFDLIKYKNDLLDMLNDYKQGKYNSDTTVIQIEPKGVKVEELTGETIQTSIRVNKNAIDKFREFSKEHSQYKVSDLISMALIEYMDKYNEQ